MKIEKKIEQWLCSLPLWGQWVIVILWILLIGVYVGFLSLAWLPLQWAIVVAVVVAAAFPIQLLIRIIVKIIHEWEE